MQLTSLPTQPWDAILRRLRQISSQQIPTGCAIVSLHIVVQSGRPVAWWEPTVRKLEPKDIMSEFLEVALNE